MWEEVMRDNDVTRLGVEENGLAFLEAPEGGRVEVRVEGIRSLGGCCTRSRRHLEA